MGDNVFHAYVFGRPVPTGDIGGLSALRQIDLNLIYTIKELILPLNGYVTRFTETISPGSLATDPDTGLSVTPYVGTYKDWVYFNPDSTNPALTGTLVVPTLNTSGSLAFIDYPNGTVYYSGTTSNTITATYDFYSVWVQDGFPEITEDNSKLEELPVPMISVDFDRRRNIPFAIGGAYEEDRTFIINITAASDAQRDDLMDILENSLRYDFPPTIDYKYGFPIKFNGDRNLSFNRNTRWKHIRFLDISSDVLRIPTAIDKLRHQGILSLTIQTN